MLGTATWRIEAIEPQRVVVGRAEGQAAMMPFWRGEDAPGRPSWARPSARSAARSPSGATTRASSAGSSDECRLEPAAARVLRDHVARQIRRRRRRPRRPDGPDRDLPRPGRRDGPGRAHAVRRQAAPGAEAGAPGPAPASGWGSRSPASTATTGSCSACPRPTSRRSTCSTA